MRTLLLVTTVLAVGVAVWSFTASDEQERAAARDIAANTEEVRDDVVEFWREADMDRAPFTDDHHWVEYNVRSADGIEIGEVERVRLNARGRVDAIVVEQGGLLEIGGDETLITSDGFETGRSGNESFIELDMSATQFEAMLEFDEDRATNYPLSNDEVGESEG